VIRYSSENIQGTARFQGMGGAFGALGGDLSSLNINPAGSAVFNNSLATFSGSIYNRDNTNFYGNNTTLSESSDAEINQAGGVFVFNSTNADAPWSKMAIAFNYDVTESFDDNIFATGRTNEGIDNYFLDFAQGLRLDEISALPGESLNES